MKEQKQPVRSYYGFFLIAWWMMTSSIPRGVFEVNASIFNGPEILQSNLIFRTEDHICSPAPIDFEAEIAVGRKVL